MKQEISGDDSPTRWVAFVHPYWLCATVCKGIACRLSHVCTRTQTVFLSLPRTLTSLKLGDDAHVRIDIHTRSCHIAWAT